jgi:hypothetical protein
MWGHWLLRSGSLYLLAFLVGRRWIACLFQSSLSLFVPAQLNKYWTVCDCFLGKPPIIPQIVVFTAQIRSFDFAPALFDHMFAHRQRKIGPLGNFLGGPVCFASA